MGQFNTSLLFFTWTFLVSFCVVSDSEELQPKITSKLDNIQSEFASVEEIVESQKVIVVFADCNCNRGLYVRSFELNIYAQNGKLISSIESQSESLTPRQKRQLKLLESEQLIEITDIRAVAQASPILKLDDIMIQIK